MAFFLSDAEWEEYENTVNSFHEDAFQHPVKFIRVLTYFDGNGKEVSREEVIDIKGLIHYNHFRSWPINTESIGGQIDRQSVLLFLNNKALEELNLIDENGNFSFKPADDKFEVAGLRYVGKGESQTAQSKEKALLHFIVLKREEYQTHKNPYGPDKPNP